MASDPLHDEVERLKKKLQALEDEEKAIKLKDQSLEAQYAAAAGNDAQQKVNNMRAVLRLDNQQIALNIKLTTVEIGIKVDERDLRKAKVDQRAAIESALAKKEKEKAELTADLKAINQQIVDLLKPDSAAVGSKRKRSHKTSGDDESEEKQEKREKQDVSGAAADAHMADASGGSSAPEWSKFNVEPADSEPSKMWSALREAKVENGFVRLPKGVSFLDQPGSKVLYIRQCYAPIWELIKAGRRPADADRTPPSSPVLAAAAAASSGQQAAPMDQASDSSAPTEVDCPWAVLNGPPGTGKTMAGFYVMKQLLDSGKFSTILYRRSKLSEAYAFLSDGRVLSCPQQFATIAFKYLIKQPDSWMIVDGMAPEDSLGMKCRVLLISSNKKEHWHDFHKHASGKSFRVFMPVWSLEELQAARDPCLLPATAADVVRIYNQWGGIARRVRELATAEDLKQAVNTVALHLAQFANVDGAALEDSNDVSSKVFHLHTAPGSFMRGRHLRCASDFVADQLYTIMEEQQPAALYSFLSASEGEQECGGLRGQLFQRFVRRELAREQTLAYRILDGEQKDQKGSLKWTAPPRFVFHDVKDLAKPAASHAQCWPYSRTLTALDFLAKTSPLGKSLVCQATVSSSHPPKFHGIDAVWPHLDDPDKKGVALAFLVPERTAASYRAQSFLNSDGHVYKRLPARANLIEQYVIGVSFKYLRDKAAVAAPQAAVPASPSGMMNAAAAAASSSTAKRARRSSAKR